jgi:hypothetical protein
MSSPAVALSGQPQTSRTGSVPRDSKTAARSMLALDFGSPRCSKRSFKKPEVRLTKNGSISIAYEFCTKSAKSGALEKNGRRERILGLGRCVAVRRFAREGPC